MQASYLTIQVNPSSDQWGIVKTLFPTIKENKVIFSASKILLHYPLTRTQAKYLAQKISLTESIAYFPDYLPRLFTVSTCLGHCFVPVELVDGKVITQGILKPKKEEAIQDAKLLVEAENAFAEAHNAHYSDKKVRSVYLHAARVLDV